MIELPLATNCAGWNSGSRNEVHGSVVLGVKSRVMPPSSITTVRITPPDEPSRAIACASTFFTKVTHSSFGMFGGGGATDVASGAKWLVTNAVPLAYLFMATQAKNLSTTTAKELEESASSTA